jgi:hypothetical protein
MSEGCFCLPSAGSSPLSSLKPSSLGTSTAQPPEHVFPFAGALNAASVCAALGMATVIAHFVRSPLAWFLAPIATTAIYMLVVAAQVTVVAAGKRPQVSGKEQRSLALYLKRGQATVRTDPRFKQREPARDPLTHPVQLSHRQTQLPPGTRLGSIR